MSYTTFSSAPPTQRSTLQTTLLNHKDRVFKINSKSCLSHTSPSKLCSKVAVVATSTLIGVGIGAGVGSATGLGTAPGALIGGGVGFGVGLAMSITIQAVEFNKWQADQKKEALKDFFEKIEGLVTNQELLCPISRRVPMDPVVSPHSFQVYERAALENWIRQHGTDPDTGQSLSLDDVRVSFSALGGANSFISRLINDQLTNMQFSETERQGLEAMRIDLERTIQNYFQLHASQLRQRSRNGELNSNQLASELRRFADAIDPQDG